jgi:synaptobrevin family protein YKT6
LLPVDLYIFAGGSESVLHQGYVCHSCAYRDFAAAVTVDEDYPHRVALEFLQQCVDEFRKKYSTSSEVQTNLKDMNLSCPGVDALFKKYSDPVEADKIMKMQKDLDETKQILLKSIDQLMERGEKLEDLIARTEDLSLSTQTFLKQSKKMNRCCTIL